VLFFVSVGMLIGPSFLWEEAGKLVAVMAIIVVENAMSALAIVRAIGGSVPVGLTVAAGPFQIGDVR
jgi:predicted Kef-type K+ transport protein